MRNILKYSIILAIVITFTQAHLSFGMLTGSICLDLEPGKQVKDCKEIKKDRMYYFEFSDSTKEIYDAKHDKFYKNIDTYYSNRNYILLVYKSDEPNDKQPTELILFNYDKSYKNVVCSWARNYSKWDKKLDTKKKLLQLQYQDRTTEIVDLAYDKSYKNAKIRLYQCNKRWLLLEFKDDSKVLVNRKNNDKAYDISEIDKFNYRFFTKYDVLVTQDDNNCCIVIDLKNETEQVFKEQEIYSDINNFLIFQSSAYPIQFSIFDVKNNKLLYKNIKDIHMYEQSILIHFTDNTAKLFSTKNKESILIQTFENVYEILSEEKTISQATKRPRKPRESTHIFSIIFNDTSFISIDAKTNTQIAAFNAKNNSNFKIFNDLVKKLGFERSIDIYRCISNNNDPETLFNLITKSINNIDTIKDVELLNIYSDVKYIFILRKDNTFILIKTAFDEKENNTIKNDGNKIIKHSRHVDFFLKEYNLLYILFNDLPQPKEAKDHDPIKKPETTQKILKIIDTKTNEIIKEFKDVKEVKKLNDRCLSVLSNNTLILINPRYNKEIARYDNNAVKNIEIIKPDLNRGCSLTFYLLIRLKNNSNQLIHSHFETEEKVIATFEGNIKEIKFHFKSYCMEIQRCMEIQCHDKPTKLIEFYLGELLATFEGAIEKINNYRGCLGVFLQDNSLLLLNKQKDKPIGHFKNVTEVKVVKYEGELLRYPCCRDICLSVLSDGNTLTLISLLSNSVKITYDNNTVKNVKVIETICPITNTKRARRYLAKKAEHYLEIERNNKPTELARFKDGALLAKFKGTIKNTDRHKKILLVSLKDNSLLLINPLKCGILKHIKDVTTVKDNKLLFLIEHTNGEKSLISKQNYNIVQKFSGEQNVKLFGDNALFYTDEDGAFQMLKFQEENELGIKVKEKIDKVKFSDVKINVV